MSFTPYEHIAAHNSPVYVGESTRLVDSREVLMESISEVNKVVLGKRKISGPFVPPPPLKGLEHATNQSTSPSGTLKRNEGSSTSTALSGATPTKPKPVARDSTTQRAPTTDVKPPERTQDPRRRRSHREHGSSLFVAQNPSPSGQENKPPSPAKSHIQPSPHDRGDLKTCEGHKEMDSVKADDLKKTRSPAAASSQSHNPTLDTKVDNDITECVRLARSAPSLELSDIARLLSHPLVNISVGVNEKVYPVHKKLLCHYSNFFRLRFQDTQATATPDEFVLPTTEETVFDAALNWLYRGSLGHIPVGINRLYHVYYLAEELGMPLLGNLVMDTIRERYRTNPRQVLSYPGIGRIHEVYRETTPNSPLRRFVVQAAYWTIIKDGSDVKDYIAGSDINGEFVRDFIRATQEKVGERADNFDPRSCAPCTFHIHDDGSKCVTPTTARP